MAERFPYGPLRLTTDWEASRGVAIAAEARQDMGSRQLVRGLVALVVVASLMVTGRAEPAVAVTPPTVTAQLVQMIPTSGFDPPSPDPSGIVYLPPSGSKSGRFEITDSEVDETTGAGYHGVNLWQVTPNGTVLDKGTTLTFSKEPTGLGYGLDGGAAALFISDDSKRRVFVVKAGNDGRYGTSDDVVTSVDTGSLGSADTEDPEYDPLTGHLFFLDGAGTEIFDVDPRDGVFGNGNDTTTHFDISQYANDFEGLSSDPSRGTLLLGARKTDRIFEITKSGALVQTIDLSQISGLSHVSGLAFAPASDGSDRNDLWIVDRKVDNDNNPNENDGMLFEVRVTVFDALPSVTLTSPNQGATVQGSVSLEATASDDNGVSVVDFYVDGASVGSDTDPVGDFTSTWDSTSVPDGSHTITATATDSNGQRSSDSLSVTVDNVDDPPSVTVLDIPIVVGTDDVEQKLSGGLTKSSGDLDMMTDGATVLAAIGLRFTNVQLPKNAAITSAYVTFFEDEAHNDSTALTIQGQRLANAPAFSAKSSVTSPARTSVRATWNPVPAWTLPLRSPYQTPDLGSIVQEIIGLQNWASGNAMAFVVTGSGKRVAESYESGFPAVLHIEYGIP
jgi:hypothetical protein